MESVIEELAPDIIRFCRGLAGGAEAGDDVAQEALTALIRRWRKSGAPDSPASYAYAAARRIDRRRRWRRRLFTPLEPWAADRAPAAEAEALERGVALREALEALHCLAPGDREALLLSAVSGLGVEEASRCLGLSASAYKMRVHRARARLASRLEVCHAG